MGRAARRRARRPVASHHHDHQRHPRRRRPRPPPRWRAARRSRRRPPARSRATARTGRTSSPRTGSCAATSARASARRRAWPAGVPLTVDLTIVDTKNGCTPLAGCAVYIWHCDQNGRYSMYSQGVTGRELPARRAGHRRQRRRARSPASSRRRTPGRWPHIHFEVFRAWRARPTARTRSRSRSSRCPADVCTAVYATDGYSQSVRQPRPDLAAARHGVLRRLLAPDADDQRRRHERIHREARRRRVTTPRRRLDQTSGCGRLRRPR